VSGQARWAALLAAVVPAGAGAYEPRFDHRDQTSLEADVGLSRDAVVVTHQPTRTELRPALHLAWGFDLTGEGNELLLGASARLGGWSDPQGSRVLAAVDVRYRGYFGLEEWKTFFEVGLVASVRSNLMIGPLVGVGVAWDASRVWGLFAAAQFSTGLGQARLASFGASTGVQLRFD
jgi:hypothetical protein